MLRAGILIIGSLFWDEDPVRAAWRKDHLELRSSVLARCPIRYGRKSLSRGNSYTMVFSLALQEEQYGRAHVVPLVRNLDTNGVLDEAVELWAAETNNNPDRSKRSISKNWGCVSLLPNPKRLDKLNDLLNKWETIVAKTEVYQRFGKNNDEELPHVKQNGNLQVPWPNDLYDVPISFDLLLATANVPESKCPSAKEIADAWKTDEGKPFVQYFRNNQYFDIRTFQDAEIEEHLSR